MTRILFLALALLAGAAEAVTETITASGTWTAPTGVTSVTVEAWGAGGGGGGQNQGSDGGGGGGGGAYSSAVVTVVPGNNYTVTIGAGGAGQTGGVGTCGTAGGASWFGSVATVLAAGGAPGCGSTGTPPPGGAGGAAAASVGTTRFDGGNGGIGRNSNPSGQGGPGGSSAGTAGAGTSGGDPWTTMVAAPPPAGGGIGGDGGDVGLNGSTAGGYGGGGGGSGEGVGRVGGSGANGLLIVTYTVPASVLSVDCVGACTTGAASVSWTVTFSEAVAGVSGGNFDLVNSGLGGAPAITSVTGGGAVWTVSASTGTGSGTLELHVANSTGVTPALSYLPFTAGQAFNIDRTAPTVSSIARADPSPTALASVSWTVTFSESVTGVDAADFALVQSGGVSGASITLVSGSGATWTVTASTGAGNGSLRLDLADDDSIVDVVGIPLGGAGAGNGDFTGEAYSIAKPVTVTASPTACTSVADVGYTEIWSALTGPLASDDSPATASVDGTVSHFLQCTGYDFAIPDGATIESIRVDVERSSNSTGNGGSQDAAMRIVKGGAIGTTDRSTATTYTTADVVEAHGGAADLWGETWTAADINAANFGAAFAATKASSAGQAHTVSVDHMSISVSYTSPSAVISIDCIGACLANAPSVSWTVTFSESVTGLTAANFALAPSGVSGAAITGVSGDSTVWTVTASTGTGDGALGLNMVDSAGVSPALTNLPFTGQVYAIDKTAPTVFAIARADPTPTALASVSWNVTFSESVTGVDATDFQLVWAGGAGGGAITSVTGAGAAWVVTASTGASNGTLGLDLIDDDTILDPTGNPLGGTGAGNGNFAGEVYTLNFTAPSFVFTDSACTDGVPIGTGCNLVAWSPQIAGQDLAGVYITAVNAAGVPTRLHPAQVSTVDMQFGLTCHDPATDAGVAAAFAGAASFPVCQPGGGTPVGWSAAVSVTFNAGVPSSALSYIFNYADAGMVELWMRNSATPAQVGYSGSFAVKPWGFSLAAACADATANAANQISPGIGDPKFCRAGQGFDVTVTAITQALNPTPNYGRELVPETAVAVWSRQLPVSGVDGTLPSGSLPFAGSGGAFGPASFTWDEVGILRADLAVGDGDYLGAGNVSGTAYVGRFYPDHFDVAITPQCGGFIYAGRAAAPGQPFTVTAVAMSGAVSPNATANYNASAGFAKDVNLTLAAGGTGIGDIYVDATPGGTAAIPVARFVADGIGQVDHDAVSGKISYVFDTSPTPATAIVLHADDADTAAGTPLIAGANGTTSARSGRLRLSNAYGSELLPLRVPVQAEYFNVSAWETNPDDSCTVIPAGAAAIGNVKPPSSLLAPTASLPVTLGGGKSLIVLTQGATKHVGSVNLALNLRSGAGDDQSCVVWGTPPPTTGAGLDWLQFPWCVGKLDPAARATFGTHKRSDEFIYLRESY